MQKGFIVKCIKLDTSLKCIELAKCLLGSLVYTSHGSRPCILTGSSNKDRYRFANFSIMPSIGDPAITHSIFIPIDTIAFNPYNAMEFNIWAKTKDIKGEQILKINEINMIRYVRIGLDTTIIRLVKLDVDHAVETIEGVTLEEFYV